MIGRGRRDETHEVLNSINDLHAYGYRFAQC